MIYIIIPTTKDRRPRTKELVKSIEETSDGIEYAIVIFENELGGWVPAIYKAIEGIDGLVWLLGSDCIVKDGALKTLYETYMNNFPNNDGVCEPYNELHGDKLCQHPFAHSKTIKKYLDKRFTHWYSDNYFTILANNDNKLVYVPDAIIEHNHFINGKAQLDETYVKIFDPVTIEKDKLLFEKLTQKP